MKNCESESVDVQSPNSCVDQFLEMSKVIFPFHFICDTLLTILNSFLYKSAETG